MKKNLVIVESPTKAKTISKILGSDFSVLSSMGHIIDLPQKKLGIDMEDNFQPEYAVISGRQKVVASIKKEGKDAENIYMATDPDREGEAIGWHIKDRIFKKKKVMRVVFHEITPAAIKEAFSKPRDFDANMVQAQAGRRILDRIVGYFLSPLLWKKIGRGLSAGRVQSVALKLIIDRERQIKSFTPQEYWEIEAQLEKGGNGSFAAKLDKVNDKKAQINKKEDAEAIAADITKQHFVIADVKKKERKRYPYAPFITSTLQQEAFNKLKFNATKTMIVAQQLYEGIEIGEPSPVGLITYMRTDSTHVAPEAAKNLRDFILKQFGKRYLPDEPNIYKVKKLAQEAHEAIRPASITYAPRELEKFLTHEQYKLYELIYNRFISSQMTPAEYLATSVDIQAGQYVFAASGSSLVFDGFTAVYNKDENGNDEEEEKDKSVIPELEIGQALKLLTVNPSQHFTKPPARYSDSSLVKALEEDGIGRPSTYAPIIHTLTLRDYVRRIKGYFYATELGFKVCDMLVEYFPAIMDVKFTATMEEELDEIEEGRLDKIKVLNDFYSSFKTSVEFAQANVKKEVITTDDICDKCGKPMIIKWGRKGKFLSCSSYPECKNAKSITTKVKCPQEGCGGELIERRSKRGFFYGCTNYPKCTFTAKALPEEKQA